MPPFVQFRLWLREGPSGERILAGLAGALLLVVVVVAGAPVSRGTDGLLTAGGPGVGTDGGTSSGTSTGGPAGGTATGSPDTGSSPTTGGSTGTSPTTGTTGTRGAPGTTGTSTGSTGGGTAGQADACAGKGSSAPGITAKQVLVDVSNISLAGPIGNSTFDLRPDLAKIASAVAADINEHGGVACGRRIVLKQYDVNPLDTNDAQTKCLQMIADKPFTVLDYGGYIGSATRKCFVNGKTPLQVSTPMGATEIKQGYPYLYGAGAQAEQLVRYAISGLNARGFFKAPAFKKLGLFEDSCDPNVNREIDKALASVGVSGDKVSKFVTDCTASAPPNQVQQAVLQHVRDGVTHVYMPASVTSNQNYVRVASSQNFRPVYGLSDVGANLVAPGQENWDASFDKTIGITSLHTGEFQSGVRNAQITACDKLLRAHGVPGITNETKDTSAMVYCDMFRLFKAAIDKAGVNPTRPGFIAALSGVGAFATALLGDGVFDKPGQVTGGDYHRAIQWRSDCSCWKILEARFTLGS